MKFSPDLPEDGAVQGLPHNHGTRPRERGRTKGGFPRSIGLFFFPLLLFLLINNIN